MEKDETSEEAALREVMEETGYSGLKIVKKLGMVTRPGTETDGTEVSKDIHLYLMKTDNYRKGKSDEICGWYGIDDAIAKMSFPQEAEFLKNVKGEL